MHRIKKTRIFGENDLVIIHENYEIHLNGVLVTFFNVPPLVSMGKLCNQTYIPASMGILFNVI